MAENKPRVFKAERADRFFEKRDLVGDAGKNETYVLIIDEGESVYIGSDLTFVEASALTDLQSELKTETSYADEMREKLEDTKTRIAELQSECGRLQMHLKNEINAQDKMCSRIAELEKENAELKAGSSITTTQYEIARQTAALRIQELESALEKIELKINTEVAGGWLSGSIAVIARAALGKKK